MDLLGLRGTPVLRNVRDAASATSLALGRRRPLLPGLLALLAAEQDGGGEGKSRVKAPRPAEAATSPSSAKRAYPRLALRKHEAALALGVSDESFDRYVVPYVRVVRCGALRLYPLPELERWLRESAELPLEDPDATG
jgi:hypothetical protein